MVERPSKTAVSAWTRLMRSQHSVLSQIERALKDAGLPPLSWYDVLLELERSKGMRPFELEPLLLLPQYSLSRLIDRIEAAGYLTRQSCEQDRRGQVIVISDAGRAMRERMWPVYAAAIEAALGSRLDKAEAEMLDELLGRLIAPVVS